MTQPITDRYPADVSEPLAKALSHIASIVDASESDPELMMAMLNCIEGIVLAARNEWFANVNEAQRKARGRRP